MQNIGRFNLRIVRNGDKYGRLDQLTHDKPEPMIEFYDVRYPDFDMGRGQFVSRYYIKTLLSDDRKRGEDWALCLHGGVPDWYLNNQETKAAVDYARAA